MIITEVGKHASVKSLVFVDAFQPDVGETAGELQNKFPPAGGKSVVPYGDGLVYVRPESFATDFAGGVPKPQKPSYATVGLDDREIDPALLRFMATTISTRG